MSEKKFKIDTNVVVDREAFGKKRVYMREYVGISRESPLRVSKELCVVALVVSLVKLPEVIEECSR